MNKTEWTGGRVLIYAAVIIVMVATSIVWIPLVFGIMLVLVSNVVVFFVTFLDTFMASLVADWKHFVFTRAFPAAAIALSIWLWKTKGVTP